MKVNILKEKANKENKKVRNKTLAIMGLKRDSDAGSDIKEIVIMLVATFERV